jgi:hypothetical protein
MNENATSLVPLIKSEYAKIGMVFCPYFGEMIRFNRKGLQHILFKSDGISRLSIDKHKRLSILHLAAKVISLSNTIQNQEKRSGKKDSIYYEFIAILDTKRVKVVLKQDGEGSKYFYSIIPFWIKKKIKDID